MQLRTHESVYIVHEDDTPKGYHLDNRWKTSVASASTGTTTHIHLPRHPKQLHASERCIDIAERYTMQLRTHESVYIVQEDDTPKGYYLDNRWKTSVASASTGTATHIHLPRQGLHIGYMVSHRSK